MVTPVPERVRRLASLTRVFSSRSMPLHMNSSTPWWLSTKSLVVLLLLGFILRVYMVFSFPVFPTIANTWDSNFYDETAKSLADGRGYSFQGAPTAYFPPGYPMSIAGGYALLGAHARTAQAMNLLFSCLLAWAACLLAKSLWGMRSARWALLILALEPSQIVMPAFLMTEVLCGFLLVGAVLLALRPDSLKQALGAAVLGTWAGMTRGTGFLILPAAYATLWFVHKETRTLFLRSFLVASLVAGAVLGAWAARNSSRLGHPVLISTNVGVNLLLGNNPQALGGRAEGPNVPQTGDEVLDEALCKRKALDYIKSNPGRILALLPLKVGRLWGFGPAVTYREELKEKLPSGMGAVVTYGAQVSHMLLFGLALWGGYRRRSSGLLWIILGAWTLGHLPFFGGARYFFPVQALLILLASRTLTGDATDRQRIV